MPWRTIDGATLADEHLSQLQVVIEGVFDRRRFLDLVRYFIVFEDAGDGVLIKKMAGYHQYHAVNAAVEETLRACAPSPETHRLGEMRGVYLVRGPDAGLHAQARRPPHRRGLAHARLRQEPDDGVLRGQDHPTPRHGEPHGRRADRPQRPGQPALRQLRAGQGPAAPGARPRPRAAPTWPPSCAWRPAA